MAEGTLQPSTDQVGINTFDVEYTQTIITGTRRAAMSMSDFPRIASLRNLFASVVVSSVFAEARQDSDVGTENTDLSHSGHVFLAVIPSSKNTDASAGGSDLIVSNVPNKQTFPLSSQQQSNQTFSFQLLGYETDLAQDPRRGAGPVAWIGNSGVRTYATGNNVRALPICTVTWRLKVMCSGPTPLWQ